MIDRFGAIGAYSDEEVIEPCDLNIFATDFLNFKVPHQPGKKDPSRTDATTGHRITTVAQPLEP